MTRTQVKILLAGMVSLLCASPAPACRCTPQTLETYFERADVVMIARATATHIIKGEPDHLRVEFAPVEEPYKGDLRSIDTFATYLSSASCGVPVEAGQMFLVFGGRETRQARTVWFDTCNGTRRFGPDAPVADFSDTPADKIALRLEGLRVGHAVRNQHEDTGGPRLPKPGHPNAELIGLLELPTILNLDEPGADSPPPRLPPTVVEVRASPAADAARSATIRVPTDVLTRAYSYEAVGAVVLEQKDDWFRIALPSDRSGWVNARSAGAFHPLAELIVKRLNYLTAHWDGWIWPDPGAGIPVKAKREREEGRQQLPVNVLGTQDLAGTLWLQIEILASDPCEGGTPKVESRGWVPAYSPEGKLTTWFHSRGC